MTAAALLRPALIDAVLALLGLETAWLLWRARRAEDVGAAGRRTAMRFALSFAVAGAGLLLALRAVLAGWPPWVALGGLAAAGAGNALHVADAVARRR
ncbi:MAG TPA: hypothetical protein VGD56_01965 [Gemmatirosa sp.]